MLVAKLEEMALVVVDVDNDDAMVTSETEGGAMTTYLTERPTIVAAWRLLAADRKKREDVGQVFVVPSLYTHRTVMAPRTQFAGKLAVNADAMLLLNNVMAAMVVMPRKD